MADDERRVPKPIYLLGAWESPLLEDLEISKAPLAKEAIYFILRDICLRALSPHILGGGKI